MTDAQRADELDETETRSSNGERSAARIVFGLVGLAALGVGVWDVTSAIGLAPRVFGAFLIAVGAFALIGAAGLRARWVAWPAWTAAIAVLGMGLVALLVDMRDRLQFGWADDRHLGFGIACTLVGCLMVGLAWRDRPDWPPRVLTGLGSPNKTPLENLKDAVELLGVAGLVLGATAFWFTEVYVPSSRLPSVIVRVELAQSGPSAVHSQFTFENASDFRVRILSSAFNIVASNAGASYDPRMSACAIDAQGRLLFEDYPGSSAAIRRPRAVVINAGRLGADGEWLEPDETLTVGFVSPLPVGAASGQPGVIRASVDLTVARGDRVAVVPEWEGPESPPAEADVPLGPEIPECGDQEHLAHAGTAHWPLVQESVFNILTRDPIELWTDWWLTQDGQVQAYSFPVKDGVQFGQSLTPEQADHLGTKLAQVLGLVGAHATQELGIDVPAPSPGT